ncbi:hypothetical protein EMPS_10722 [Entomortierella parvispora]|uniref:Protein kinase domain-containing protein n=1 Tax=Entomortierella parvispora TaxID=205924 RepID=A0A9P3HL47_9FUNG|nr:hypothetical protein EMPS_10722 [Entomortierella parvispora]
MQLQSPRNSGQSKDWIEKIEKFQEIFEKSLIDERQKELQKYRQQRIIEQQKLLEEFQRKTKEGERSLLDKLDIKEKERRAGFEEAKTLLLHVDFQYESVEEAATISSTTVLTETVCEIGEDTFATVAGSLPALTTSKTAKTGKSLPPVPPPKPAALALSTRHSVATGKATRLSPSSSSPSSEDKVRKPGVATVGSALHVLPSVSKMIGVSAISTSDEKSDVKMVNGEWVKKIGSYIYYSEKTLGEGGEARVFKCLNMADGCDYAIREIHMKVDNQADNKKITDEIALMKKLHHPNAIQLHEVMFCPKSSTWYMVLELCKGELVKLSRDGKTQKDFSENQCRDYFQQLLLGMEYVHKHKIAHRDIKPGNLLISKEGKLKIADFGISRMFATDQDMLYRSGKGTRAFMAPEIFRNHDCEHDGKQVDIWSMGVTLFLMWNGELPFMMGSALHPNYDSPAGFRDGTPEPLKELLNQLLEKDPTKRITLDQLRNNPWVVDNGRRPLARSKEDNEGGDIVVTDEDRSMAVGRIQAMAGVFKAASLFIASLSRNKGRTATCTLEVKSEDATSGKGVDRGCEKKVLASPSQL